MASESLQVVRGSLHFQLNEAVEGGDGGASTFSY